MLGRLSAFALCLTLLLLTMRPGISAAETRQRLSAEAEQTIASTPSLTQVAPSVPSAVALPRETPDTLAREARFDGYFGLYVNGNKVGYLHEVITDKPAIEMRVELEATLGGMGQTTHVSMRERRRYASVGEGKLTSIAFRQRAQTGELVVEGTQKGSKFDVTIVSGGARRRHQLEMPETVADALAAFRLAKLVRSGKSLHVGDFLETTHFDAASQTLTGSRVTVDGIEQQLLGGLPSQVLHLTTRYPTLALEEKTSLDSRGRVMRMQIGAFFEARREDESVAKAPVVPGDVLQEAVMAVPTKLPSAQLANELVLTLSGLQNATLPQSTRQTVQPVGQRWDVTLRRDAPVPPLLKLQDVQKAVAAHRHLSKRAFASEEQSDIERARRPNPWVQSDAPELIAMAKQAAGSKKYVGDVIDALIAATRGHITSEYVPSFSNALEVYRSRRGDCTEYSVLFVALARALGLPARVAVGTAYWPAGNGFGWHAWAEVYDGLQWRSVDPTWGQSVADVTHLKVADGDPSSQVRLIMLLGQMRLDAWRISRT